MTELSPAAGDGEPSGRGLTKVYWSKKEKKDFADEAANHNQTESEYARLILSARKDPWSFLHMCRLLNPGFAAGFGGGSNDAAKVADLERRLLAVSQEKVELEQDRDGLRRRNEELERGLADATARAQALAQQVLDHARLQAANGERAAQAGVLQEAVSRLELAVVKVLTTTPRLHKTELERRLHLEGLTPEEAAQAIRSATRRELVVRGGDNAYRLAKRPVEDDE